jgi:hypothetical protein
MTKMIKGCHRRHAWRPVLDEFLARKNAPAATLAAVLAVDLHAVGHRARESAVDAAKASVLIRLRPITNVIPC